MNEENINEVADFKRLSELENPIGTELTLELQGTETVNVIIKEHMNAYNDPLAQKYKLEGNGTTSYLFFEDLQVRIAKEDADGLPLGTKRTVVQITTHE